MATFGDDLAHVSRPTLRPGAPTSRSIYRAGMGVVVLAAMTVAAPSAKSQAAPTCRTEPLLPTAPGTFGARPGSILSPGHRRSVHSLLSPRDLPRCPPVTRLELDVPPPSQLQRVLVVPDQPRKTRSRVEPVVRIVPKRASKAATDALGSTARTQRALAAIGLPLDRTDGVLSNETTSAIQSYQSLLGAPKTGRLTKGQRELLWELSAAAKK